MLRQIMGLLGARAALAIAELQAEKTWREEQFLMKIVGIGLLVTAGLLGVVMAVAGLTEIDPLHILGGAVAIVTLVGAGLLLAVLIRARHHQPILSLTWSVVKSDLARLGLRSLLR